MKSLQYTIFILYTYIAKITIKNITVGKTNFAIIQLCSSFSSKSYSLRNFIFHNNPGGTTHWMIYAFEVLSGYYCFSITVGVDSVFGYYALHIVGQLRLLAARFQNLKPGDNYKKELKECVDRHVVLMKAKLIMERVFGFLSMWLAVTCAIVMCAIIFQCTEVI